MQTLFVATAPFNTVNPISNAGLSKRLQNRPMAVSNHKPVTIIGRGPNGPRFKYNTATPISIGRNRFSTVMKLGANNDSNPEKPISFGPEFGIPAQSVNNKYSSFDPLGLDK